MSENKYSNQASEGQALEGFLPETHLLEALGIKKTTLDYLRHNRGFPFMALTKTERLYFLPDIREWLLTRQQNKAVLVSFNKGDHSP